MGKRIDESGNRYGRLTVLALEGRNGFGYALWRCRCDCGAETVVPGHSLRSGNTKSCGCLNIEKSTERIVSRNTKHGKTHDPLFRRWANMLTRCENQNATNYADYGGRGIKVCEEWHSFETFYNWAMSHGYKPELSLDRLDNDKGYEPNNCHWTTDVIQARNRRSTRFFTFRGETMCITDWAAEFGVDPSNLSGHTDDEIRRKLTEYARRKL